MAKYVGSRGSGQGPTRLVCLFLFPVIKRLQHMIKEYINIKE